MHLFRPFNTRLRLLHITRNKWMSKRTITNPRPLNCRSTTLKNVGCHSSFSSSRGLNTSGFFATIAIRDVARLGWYRIEVLRSCGRKRGHDWPTDAAVLLPSSSEVHCSTGTPLLIEEYRRITLGGFRIREFRKQRWTAAALIFFLKKTIGGASSELPTTHKVHWVRLWLQLQINDHF